MTRTETTTTIKTTNYYLRALAVLVALAVAMSSLVEAARPAKAAFPGSNGKIAFVSGRDGGNGEIYAMYPDGSNQTNLTNNPANDFESAVSPDGKKIAFVSRRDGNDEVYVMDASGANPTNLTNDPGSDDSPNFSRTARR